MPFLKGCFGGRFHESISAAQCRGHSPTARSCCRAVALRCIAACAMPLGPTQGRGKDRTLKAAGEGGSRDRTCKVFDGVQGPRASPLGGGRPPVRRMSRSTASHFMQIQLETCVGCFEGGRRGSTPSWQNKPQKNVVFKIQTTFSLLQAHQRSGGLRPHHISDGFREGCCHLDKPIWVAMLGGPATREYQRRMP